MRFAGNFILRCNPGRALAAEHAAHTGYSVTDHADPASPALAGVALQGTPAGFGPRGSLAPLVVAQNQTDSVAK